MSLVNEALRKARLEATRQDAARRGAPPPAIVDQPASGRAARWALPLAAAALVLAIGTMLFLIGRMTATPAGGVADQTTAAVDADGNAATGREIDDSGPTAESKPAPTSTERTTEAGSAAAYPAAGSLPTGARTDPPSAPAADAASQRAAADERTNTPASTVSGAGGRSTSEPAPAAPRAASPEPSAPPRAAAAPPPDRDRVASFVREAQIDGAGRVELGGIAWSAERPFALINGRLVGPGERVLGLLVRDIQPGMVELEGDGGRYRLTLR